MSFKLLTILFILVIGVSVNAKPTTTTTTKPGGFSAGSFGCWGDDFCTTTVTTEGMYSVVINNGDGTVTFKWDLRDFNTENIKYYSTRTFFTATRDQVMNSSDCKNLGLKMGTLLLKGQYPIKNENGLIITTIKIK